jgi:hypothetical protein
MPWEEIEIPKEVLHFMPEGAEETTLGQKNGAKKQYRYGRLHIREYDDKYLVHMDKVDPRENPLGHLISDAPEVLVGLVCAVFGGKKIAANVFQKNNSKATSATAGIISGLALGYLGYTITKKLKGEK